jgi:DnaK suppressor protein
MDGYTLEKIRGLLLARWTRDENLSDADAGNFNSLLLDEEPNSSAEMIDIAQGLEQQGRDTLLREADRRELIAVERALSKMALGSFGVCEDCSEEIPSKRLMVLPAARLCANCQAFEEKQNQRLQFAR